MKDQVNSQDVPMAADIFKIVQVVRIDGKSTCVPVQLMDDPMPVSALGGKVLHIVMTKNAFCAWRGH